MAREVFISYKKEDKAAADRICRALERDNIKCWMASRDVPVGREWAASIVQALKASRSFVLVLSSNSKNAKQISREAELADNIGLPIITVRIEDVEPPPELQYFLGNIQWLDAFGPDSDSAMERLAEVVRDHAVSPADLADIPAPTQTPPTARAAAAAASAAPPDPRSHFPRSSEASQSPASPVLSPLDSAPPSPRPNLRPYIIVSALIVAVVLGVGIWWATRKPAYPSPSANAAEAGAFGFQYMQQRDFGRLDLAYSMTGPAFQKHWPYEKFAAALKILRSRRKVNGYVPVGPCAERERGAYACEYRVSYADGTTQKHGLTIAKQAGEWRVASDPSLTSSIADSTQ